MKTPKVHSLADLAVRYKDHLEWMEYAQDTIRLYIQGVSNFIGWLESKNLDSAAVTRLNTAEGINILQSQAGWDKRHKNGIDGFCEFVKPRRSVKFARFVEHEPVRLAYVKYLRNERQLVESSIYNFWRYADRFLEYHFGDKVADFSKLTPLDIRFYIRDEFTSVTGRNMLDSTGYGAVRAFLRFLYLKKHLVSDYSKLLLPPRKRPKPQRQIEHITQSDVDTILSHMPKKTKIHKRDHAVFLLLARYGLRSPEIFRMMIDDFSWREGTLTIRGKGGYHDVVLLTEEVGDAVAQYIKDARPRNKDKKERHLFLASMAPHRPFVGSQFINSIVQREFARNGLNVQKGIGPYLLRHSFAMELRKAGVAIKDIQKVLRHRSIASTKIYAQPNFSTLLKVAGHWPTSSV